MGQRGSRMSEDVTLAKKVKSQHNSSQNKKDIKFDDKSGAKSGNKIENNFDTTMDGKNDHKSDTTPDKKGEIKADDGKSSLALIEQKASLVNSTDKKTSDIKRQQSIIITKPIPKSKSTKKSRAGQIVTSTKPTSIPTTQTTGPTTQPPGSTTQPPGSTTQPPGQTPLRKKLKAFLAKELQQPSQDAQPQSAPAAQSAPDPQSTQSTSQVSATLNGVSTTTIPVTLPDPSCTYFIGFGSQLTGDCQVDGHVGDIQLSSFSWGAGVTHSISPIGVTVGRPNFHPFSVKKTLDSTSPSLFFSAANGDVFTSVTISCRKSGSSTDFFTISFSDVVISSYSTSSSPSSTPTEEISFIFQKMTMSQNEPNNAPITASWTIFQS